MKAFNIILLSAGLSACRTSTDESSSNAEIEDLKAAVLDLQAQIAECAKVEETASISAMIEEESAARAETDDALAAIQADYVVASDLEGLATAMDIGDLDGKIAANEAAIDAQGLDIIGLQTDVAANVASLSTHWADIAANTVSISSHWADIMANSSAIGTNSSAITTIQGSVSNNTTAITALQTNESGLSASVAANATAIYVNEMAHGANASDIAANATAIGVNQVDISANATAIAAIQNDYVTTSDMDAMTILTDEVWTVGPSATADYPTLHEALEASYDLSIHANAKLTLQLEDGTHYYTETVNVKHPDGINLRIHGNLNDPSAVQLYFSTPDSYYGILVDYGHSLGSLRGMSIHGDGVETINGLFVNRGSYAFIDDLVATNWASSGIYTSHGSILFTGESVETHNNIDWGVLVSYNSILHGSSIYSHSNNSGIGVYWDSFAYVSGALVENNDEGGIRGAFGGAMDMRTSTSRNNGYYGFDTGHGTVGFFGQSTSEYNGYDGYFAYEGGLLNADNSLANGNNHHGFSVGLQSYMRAFGSASNNNAYGEFGQDPYDGDYNRILLR